MNHSTGNPTKAQAARFTRMKGYGCVACELEGKRELDECGDPLEIPDIHHYLSGGQRIGHDASVPLCRWHHKGVPYDGVPTAWFLANVGPSFHRHTRQFRARYGTDAELLATTNAMIGETA